MLMMTLNVLDNYTRTYSLSFWKCAIGYRSQYHASIVSKLWTQNYEISSTDVLCHRCGMMYKDKYVHAVVVCEEMALLREDFYAHVRQTFGNQVYNELRSGSDERKRQTLIGKRVLALLNLNIQKHSFLFSKKPLFLLYILVHLNMFNNMINKGVCGK